MFSIIGSILGAVVKGLMAFFLPSKDEKLGALEVTDKIQSQELKNVQIKNTINNTVDSSDNATRQRMSADLNNADK